MDHRFETPPGANAQPGAACCAPVELSSPPSRDLRDIAAGVAIGVVMIALLTIGL